MSAVFTSITADLSPHSKGSRGNLGQDGNYQAVITLLVVTGGWHRLNKSCNNII